MQEEEIDPLGWRLADSIVRGEIDSRERDRIVGRIWLLDRQFPLEISLRGNPMRDIAGCLMEFENPHPMPEDSEGLSPVQMGVPGIITASRKVRVLDFEASDATAASAPLQEIRKVGNAIWIEWFSNANGRVVIHATDFQIHISDFTWRMTATEEQTQIRNSQKAHEHWREIVATENGADDIDPEDYLEDTNWYMDEFEWERQFQESDAISKRYMLLMETFLDHPDRDKRIAHEMGWNEDASDAFEADYMDELEDDVDWEDVLDIATNLAPNPATEGVDWIQSPDGKIQHPLTQRAAEVVRNIWRTCKEHDQLSKDQTPDMQAMLFHAQTLNAKLAGALDSLAYDDEPDGGFIVACLKRALQSFVLTMKSLGSVAQHDVLPPERIASFKDELFHIRQEVLRLMQHFRHINDV